MQESDVRGFAEAHANAVVAGDQGHLMSDFIPDVLPSLGPVAAAIPQPTKQAEVLAVDLTGDEAVVRIKYDGDSGSATIQTRWEERDGRPKIVAAEVV